MKTNAVSGFPGAKALPILAVVAAAMFSTGARAELATSGDLGYNVIYGNAGGTYSFDLTLTRPDNSLPATLDIKYGMWNGSGDIVEVFLNSVGVGSFEAIGGYISPGPQFSSFSVKGLLVDGANTVSFLGGEPRSDYVVGQIDLTYSTAPVPEPETYAMMLAGLGVLGALARRRRVR